MNASSQIRELAIEDCRRLEDIFARFRSEFSVWADDYPSLWELLAFVHYEGINLPIVQETEPFVMAQKAVSLYKARWCMLAHGNEWHFAIDHDDFDQPIDLTKFNRRQLTRTLSRKWKRILLMNDYAA